jgi:hypothetical protein
MSEDKPWTMPVPAAGKKYYGLSRSGSYAAAKTGAMPTKWINGKLLALPRVIERQLEEAGTQSPSQANPSPTRSKR